MLALLKSILHIPKPTHQHDCLRCDRSYDCFVPKPKDLCYLEDRDLCLDHYLASLEGRA